MSSDYWYGAVVYHNVFGYGKVIGYRARYKQAQVKFEDITIWIETEELQKVAVTEVKKISLERIDERLELDKETARKIIEAFRLGIVPEAEIDKFTYDRKQEIGEIKECFKEVENEGASSAIIIGEYGTGKTHFLDLISTFALREGYVVAKAEMDTYEIRPHRPKRVFSALMENIKWEVNSCSRRLRDFFDIAIQNRSVVEVMKNHKFFGPVIDTIIKKKNDDIEGLYNYLEAKDGMRIDLISKQYKNYRLQALYDYGQAADLYCYILTGLSYAARKLGFKGLVVLIDEAESIYSINYAEQIKANNFIKGLLCAAGKKDYKDDSLLHSRIDRSFPYCYIYPNYLFVVFAMTARFEDYDEPDWYREIRKIELSPIDENDMQEIYNKLKEIYKIAYPSFHLDNEYDLQDIIFQIWRDFEIERIEFRQAIKSIIEALDIKRHFPLKELVIPKRNIRKK